MDKNTIKCPDCGEEYIRFWPYIPHHDRLPDWKDAREAQGPAQWVGYRCTLCREGPAPSWANGRFDPEPIRLPDWRETMEYRRRYGLDRQWYAFDGYRHTVEPPANCSLDYWERILRAWGGNIPRKIANGLWVSGGG